MKDHGECYSGGRILHAGWWWAGAAFAAAAVWLACFAFGRQQFGGFDHSVLVDLCWRINCGQQPYLDFPCTVPPTWVAGIELSNRLFGATWGGLLAFNATFAAGTFVWMFALAWRLCSSAPLALLVAASIQSTSSIVVGYWWYNPTTSVIACVAVMSATLECTERRGALSVVSTCASVALLAGVKPNVALPLTPLVALALLANARRIGFARIIAIGLGTVTLIGIGIALSRLNPLETIAAYRSIAGRGLKFDTFRALLSDLPPAHWRMIWPLGALAAGLVLVASIQLRSRTFILAVPALTLAAVGTIAFLTNGEHKAVDCSMVLAAGLIMSWSPSIQPRPSGSALPALRWIAAVTAVAWIAYGVSEGVKRERVRFIGPPFAASTSPFAPRTEFFSLLQPSSEFLRLEDAISGCLVSYPSVSVYFGPRLQWAYAAFKLRSPGDEPVWWHPGVAFGQSEEERWLDRWKIHAHDLLIFMRDDRTYMPEPMTRWISERYQRVPSDESLDVFRRVNTEGGQRGS